MERTEHKTYGYSNLKLNFLFYFFFHFGLVLFELTLVSARERVSGGIFKFAAIYYFKTFFFISNQTKSYI